MRKIIIFIITVSAMTFSLSAGSKSEPVISLSPEERLFSAIEADDINKVSDLLQKDTADLSSLSGDGETLLTLTASAGQKDLLVLLLNNQAPKDKTNSQGLTPLLAAIEKEHYGIATTLLLWDVNTAIQDSQGEDALFKAVKAGEGNLAEKILEIQQEDMALDSKGNRSLHWAVRLGDQEMIQLLLPFYNSIEIANDEGETPLSLALDQNIEILGVLLENQDLLNITFQNGSLLHYAVYEGNSDLVSFFLNKDIELLKLKNETGELPLDIALDRPKSTNHILIAEKLIKEGSPENSKKELSYFYKTVQQGRSDIDFGGGNRALHFAAERNHTGIAELLFESYSPLVDARNENGTTALLAAVRGGNEGMVEKLIAQGASALLADSNGISSIHYAVRLNNYRSMIDLLTQAGASVNQQDILGNTPLHSIIELNLGAEKSAYLLTKGANPNIRNIQGNTPLLESILEEQKEISQQLQSRSDIFAQNQRGLSPLTVVLAKNTDVLDWFFNDNNINDNDYQGNSVLHYAASYDQKELSGETLLLLLRKGAQINSRNASGKTPLHLAVESFYWATANFLVNQGGNLYLLDNSNFSPLTASFERGGDFTQSFLTEGDRIIDLEDAQGNTPLFYAIQEGYPFIASLLIQLDADFNHSNLRGVTPLLLSIEKNDINLFYQLTDKGADIEQRDNNGDGALHYLVKSSEDFATDLGERLIDLGLSPDNQNLQEMTPLHYSAHYKNHEALRFLVESGAKLEISDQKGFTAIFYTVMENDLAAYRYLKSKGANIKVRDYNGNTLLHGAVIQSLQSPNKELIRRLINDGADIYGLNAKGDSPLELAITLGPVILDRILYEDSINLQNNQGDSPLHIALEISDDPQVWAFLMDLGADPLMRNGKGLTPYRLGQNMGYSEEQLEIIKPQL